MAGQARRMRSDLRLTPRPVSKAARVFRPQKSQINFGTIDRAQVDGVPRPGVLGQNVIAGEICKNTQEHSVQAVITGCAEISTIRVHAPLISIIPLWQEMAEPADSFPKESFNARFAGFLIKIVQAK